jgi:hypothetical protein
MLIKDVAKLSPMDRWVYFVKERDSIRAKRALGLEKPWTDDEILRQYRFCNVRRMDDKVSRWLQDNWYIPYKDNPRMLAACTLARHFNLPEALNTITGYVFENRKGIDLASIKVELRARKAAGLNIFNGAYMVRGIGEIDKTEMVVERVVKPLIDNPPAIDHVSMQQAVESLLPYWGFSLFMAGQVVADLRWATTGSWRDRRIWAPMGPGSARGMNRLLDFAVKRPMSQATFLEELQKLIQVGTKQLPDVAKRLEAIDWQNTLCEYDKYSRCLLGEGRPKQRYPGA